MSFLVNIIAPKLIDLLEEQIIAHEPDVQEAIWNEVQAVASYVIDKVKEKIPSK